jgi:hypothetical protein
VTTGQATDDILQRLADRGQNPPLRNKRKAETYDQRCNLLLAAVYGSLGFIVFFILVWLATNNITYSYLWILFGVLAVYLYRYPYYEMKMKRDQWLKPLDLFPHELELEPTSRNGALHKLRLDMMISPTDQQKIQRLCHSIKTTVYARYNQFETLPELSDLSPCLEQSILPELEEMDILVFRHQLFESQIDEPAAPGPQPPLI